MRTLHIQHETIYDYESTVSTSHHAAHIEPCFHPQQNVLQYQCQLSPSPVEDAKHLDYFGNPTNLFRIDQSHQSLRVKLDIWVQRHEALIPPSGPSWLEAEDIFKRKTHTLPKDCWPFLCHSTWTPFIKDIHEYTRQSFVLNVSLLEACMDLMHRIHKDFSFDAKFSKVDTPLADVFKHKKGVCQDFAHIMLSGLRSMGIPSRYVSGYIETLPPPGKEKLVGVDASHAWVGIYFPNAGWVEFDPTNDMIPSDHHVVIATGRDYLDVSPLKGVFHGLPDHLLKVSVDVREVENPPSDSSPLN